MPCRVHLFHCNHCGGAHYYANECLTDPTKYREGLSGYDRQTAAIDGGEKAIEKKINNFNVEGALCDVLSLLEDKKILNTTGIPEDILDWWELHQSKENKKIKREALAKLSAKEKRALGLSPKKEK